MTEKTGAMNLTWPCERYRCYCSSCSETAELGDLSGLLDGFDYVQAAAMKNHEMKQTLLGTLLAQDVLPPVLVEGEGEEKPEYLE